MRELLTRVRLHKAAQDFCIAESKLDFPELVGITDGKAVGTFVEHRLKNFLSDRFEVVIGNSTSGIDLPSPEINTCFGEQDSRFYYYKTLD
jgi:hypothetical protein